MPLREWLNLVVAEAAVTDGDGRTWEVVAGRSNNTHAINNRPPPPPYWYVMAAPLDQRGGGLNWQVANGTEDEPESLRPAFDEVVEEASGRRPRPW